MASISDYANLLGSGPSYIGGLAGAAQTGTYATTSTLTSQSLERAYQQLIGHHARQLSMQSFYGDSVSWKPEIKIKEREDNTKTFREELQAEVSAWLQ